MSEAEIQADPAVWQDVLRVMGVLADPEASEWNMTVTELRANPSTAPAIDFSEAPAVQLAAEIQGVVAEFLNELATIQAGDESVNEIDELTRFTLASAVVFGESNQMAILFTPRSLAAYLAESRSHD